MAQKSPTLQTAAMNYWVLKANPGSYRYEDELHPLREENWGHVVAAQGPAPGDRIFLWASAPALHLAGLGIAISPNHREAGEYVLRVRYLTAQLAYRPTLRELKAYPRLAGAHFLQRARYGTAYPLTPEQGNELYRIVVGANPEAAVWEQDVAVEPMRDVDAEASEGRLTLVTHLIRERNPQQARRKKEAFVERHGALFCEACGETHLKYGNLAARIFEVHHLRPLSASKREVKTCLDDLAVLCPNCHRAIHRTDPFLTVAAFARRLRNAAATSAKSTRKSPVDSEARSPARRSSKP